MTKRELHGIDLKALSTVTGGEGAAPISIGSIDMGAPKYSAKWWAFVNTPRSQR